MPLKFVLIMVKTKQTFRPSFLKKKTNKTKHLVKPLIFISTFAIYSVQLTFKHIWNIQRQDIK